MYLQNYADHTQYHIIYDSYIYMIIYVHGSLELRSSVVVLKSGDRW